MLFINPNSWNSITGSGKSKSMVRAAALAVQDQSRSRILNRYQLAVVLAGAGVAFEHQVHVG
jgi:hypothetical protein